MGSFPAYWIFDFQYVKYCEMPQVELPNFPTAQEYASTKYALVLGTRSMQYTKYALSFSHFSPMPSGYRKRMASRLGDQHHVDG